MRNSSRNRTPSSTFSYSTPSKSSSCPLPVINSCKQPRNRCSTHENSSMAAECRLAFTCDHRKQKSEVAASSRHRRTPEKTGSSEKPANPALTPEKGHLTDLSLELWTGTETFSTTPLCVNPLFSDNMVTNPSVTLLPRPLEEAQDVNTTGRKACPQSMSATFCHSLHAFSFFWLHGQPANDLSTN